MINFRQIMGQLKRMGINVKQINAKKVIIETSEKRIILESPEVLLLSSPQGEIYQIVAHNKKEEEIIGISEDDIKFVMEQTGVDEKTAIEYLKKHKGDIAKAIDDILASRK